MCKLEDHIQLDSDVECKPADRIQLDFDEECKPADRILLDYSSGCKVESSLKKIISHHEEKTRQSS